MNLLKFSKLSYKPSIVSNWNKDTDVNIFGCHDTKSFNKEFAVRSIFRMKTILSTIDNKRVHLAAT